MPYKGKKNLTNDRVAQDVIAIDARQKVLNGIIAAKSDRQIAEESGLSKHQVKRLKTEIRNVMTKNYHDQIEHVRTVAFSRLERLSRTIFAMALGDKSVSITGFPDRHWAKLAIEVTRAQVDVVKSDLERHQETERDHFNYTNVNILTLNANDEMYRLANDELWKDWQQHDTEDYRQILLNEIVDNDSTDVPDYAAISQQLTQIESTFIIPADEEESDDDDDYA